MELEGAGKKRKERREYLKNSLGDDDIYIYNSPTSWF